MSVDEPRRPTHLHEAGLGVDAAVRSEVLLLGLFLARVNEGLGQDQRRVLGQEADEPVDEAELPRRRRGRTVRSALGRLRGEPPNTTHDKGTAGQPRDPRPR